MSSKKELIILAAIDLFTSKGIDSTSTASIAKHAKVGTGTVFHHFSNKEELVDECFRDVKRRLQDDLKTAVSDDFFKQARLYWEVAIKWFLKHKKETNFLVQYQSDPKVTGGKVLSVISSVSDLILDFMDYGKAHGLIGDYPSDYLCLLAHNNTILAAQYLMENRDVDVDKFIEDSWSIFLNGGFKK